MNSKLMLFLLGFAGLASLGGAAVVVVDPLFRREVVVRTVWAEPVCASGFSRVVYAPREPARPSYGCYERVIIVRRDGGREIRYVYVPGARCGGRR